MGEDEDVRAPKLSEQGCAFGDKAWGADIVAKSELVKAGVKIMVERAIAKPTPPQTPRRGRVLRPKRAASRVGLSSDPTGRHMQCAAVPDCTLLLGCELCYWNHIHRLQMNVMDEVVLRAQGE